MVRASVAAEKAGIHSVSIVGRGFVHQARWVAKALGVEDLAIAEYPDVIMNESREGLQAAVESILVDQISEKLKTPARPASAAAVPAPRETVFAGTLDEVHEHFHQRLWSDGLPIVPPTVDRVERFLRFTDRDPDQVLGTLLPENREATVWSVAVNGVMAGCRPEYMPILIAAVEAIAEPEFRIEDGGSTPGWEPLIILSGPIVRELGFNCESGMMRVGQQANTSVGRFLRLFMRNVAGLRTPPGTTDKATFGLTFNVALAENEDAVREIGWQPFSVDRGFRAGENVVTVQSVIGISQPTYSAGDHAEEHARTIAEIIGRGAWGNWAWIGLTRRAFYPLLAMSPSVARVFARDGWSKDDIRRYLAEHVKVEADALVRYAWQTGGTKLDLHALAASGWIPQIYAESDDPTRLVPAFAWPEWIGIVVAGDPYRNQSRGYLQNHQQGRPASKRVDLPANWEARRGGDDRWR